MSGPRLSIIPAGAVTDLSLEPRDLQVLCLLGRHTDKAGWCSRSQVRMAGEISCGRATLQRAIERLCEAGWVQKKRLDGAPADEQPSRSYAYRVILDRDDEVFDHVADDDNASYAETAKQEGGCPPVGTPEGAHLDGHPGAHPYVGTGAHTYVGTNNVPLERPPIERERDARARGDERARFIVDFEARWPTAAADNRQRTAYAAEQLTPDERKAALAGIGPFLANLKSLGRKGVPAGSTYLEEKRWTLLEAKAAAAAPAPMWHARDSAEAKAITAIFEVAGNADFLRLTRLNKADGSISFNLPVTPRLLALATAPERDRWATLTAQQAAAWEGFIGEFVKLAVRRRLGEGSVAPWPWPPRKDGSVYVEGEGDGARHDDDQ